MGEILDKVKSLGFTAISIYMPWEVHEIERGQFDFGSIDPNKDLDAFLTLAEEKGLRTIARPGPQINSELTWFGYPRRILDDPELQALNAQGGKPSSPRSPDLFLRSAMPRRNFSLRRLCGLMLFYRSW
jgi:beta-galactosidase